MSVYCCSSLQKWERRVCLFSCLWCWACCIGQLHRKSIRKHLEDGFEFLVQIWWHCNKLYKKVHSNHQLMSEVNSRFKSHFSFTALTIIYTTVWSFLSKVLEHTVFFSFYWNLSRSSPVNNLNDTAVVWWPLIFSSIVLSNISPSRGLTSQNNWKHLCGYSELNKSSAQVLGLGPFVTDISLCFTDCLTMTNLSSYIQ